MNLIALFTGMALTVSIHSYASVGDDYKKCLEDTTASLVQEYSRSNPPTDISDLAKSMCDQEFDGPILFEPWITLPNGHTISKTFANTYVSFSEAKEICKIHNAELPSLEEYQELALYMKQYDESIETARNSNIVKKVYRCVSDGNCKAPHYIKLDGPNYGSYWTSTPANVDPANYGTDAFLYLEVPNINRSILITRNGDDHLKREGYQIEGLPALVDTPRFVRCMKKN